MSLKLGAEVFLRTPIKKLGLFWVIGGSAEKSSPKIEDVSRGAQSTKGEGTCQDLGNLKKIK